MFADATNLRPASILDRIVGFFAEISATIAGVRAARRVYDRYSHLSESQLAARGLTREDIGRMTLQAMIHASGK